jgi:hypothetical protein
LCGEIEAGIGGGGDDNEPAVGGGAAEFVDNFLELDNFADADGMEPCDGPAVMFNGELSEEFLGKSAAVSSVAEHSPEDDGGECGEESEVEGIEEPAHRKRPCADGDV